MLTALYVAVVVILLFGASIFIHEFGHYWMARRRGLKVEAFAIGFGPKIFSWNRDGIEYSVRWIPAGGFVKLPQMVTSQALEGENTGEKVPPASPWSKILVAFFGPVMNVFFAFFIATIIYFVGLPVPINPPIIGYVDPKSAEGQLGIREGDRIVAVNGKSVDSWQQVYNITMLALTNVLPVSIERGGVTNTYNLRAEVNDQVKLKWLNLDPRDHPIINAVMPGTPAEAAKLQADDEIVAFAGVPVNDRKQFVDLVQKRSGMATPIVVKRGSEQLSMTVTPTAEPGSKMGRVGIEFKDREVVRIEHPTPWAQVSDVWDQMVGTVNALVHSRQSGVKASDLSGPVGIISVLSLWVKTDLRRALSFLVLLNVNLAVLNLLPVPVLDGGHIVMALIERVRRKPLGARFVEWTTTAFAFLLIGFMLYVTVFDIKRFPLFKSLFKRETQIEKVEKPAPAPAGTNVAQ